VFRLHTSHPYKALQLLLLLPADHTIGTWDKCFGVEVNTVFSNPYMVTTSTGKHCIILQAIIKGEL